MGKRGAPTDPGTLLAHATLHGLQQGQRAARKRSARRRRKNLLVNGVVAAIVAGVVGGAGYYGWQFYREEQDKQTGGEFKIPEKTPHEAIDILENSPRWNGPGNPNFGVGDGEP